MKLVAKTFFGLESVLAEEIKAIGGQKVEVGNRAVSYEGNKELLYRSNLWLRTAISVLVPIASFRYKDQQDLIRQFGKINFSPYMQTDQTFAVKGAVHSKEFSYSKYPMLLLKDAIVDFFNEKYGNRPSVDTKKPKVLFDLHISEQDCTISLNSSGAPLFQRGYRRNTGDAPLNEAIAAGLVMLSGWDKKSTLVDFMCGSGTIPIEAALIANEIPPNIARKYYSFQNWMDYDRALWEKIYDAAPNRPKRDLTFEIIGSDTDGEVVKMARDNTKALPLGKTIRFEIKDFRDFEAPENGILITNPPYGERLSHQEDVEDLYKAVGDYFKHRLPGYNCWVLSANLDAFKCLELKPSSKLEVFNGSLRCEYRKYEIFKGSMVEHKYGNQ